jgi:hypothetical protein
MKRQIGDARLDRDDARRLREAEGATGASVPTLASITTSRSAPPLGDPSAFQVPQITLLARTYGLSHQCQGEASMLSPVRRGSHSFATCNFREYPRNAVHADLQN